METTMAATPKARDAAPGELAFPVPPLAQNTARMMPMFAFPPHEMMPTRRTTARALGRRSAPLSDGLAGIASLVESVPLPALPDTVWTAIGRAWFFIAGATAGILLALALIAICGTKRAPTAADRGIGHLLHGDQTAQ